MNGNNFESQDEYFGRNKVRDDGKTLRNKVYRGWVKLAADMPCPLEHDWVPDANGYRCETCNWVIDYEAVLRFLIEEKYL